MHIEWKGIWAVAVAIYFFIKQWYAKLEPVLLPLIKDAEQRTIDGKIDKADRKAIVMQGLAIAQQQGLIKLNFIEKLVVGKIVDIIAEKLPDIPISNNASKIIDSAVNLMQKK